MTKHILLCDDEIHILRAAEFKLKKAGYDVTIVFDGEAAWEHMQHTLPDLVVTDYQMPQLDGLGLITRMRTDDRFAHVPVYMLTAKGFELDAERLAGQLQISGVIAKPFSPRELLERVRQALGEEVTS